MRFGMEKPGTIDFEQPVFKLADDGFKMPVPPMKQAKRESNDNSAVRTAFGSSSKDRNLHKRDDSFLTSRHMSPFFGSSVQRSALHRSGGDKPEHGAFRGLITDLPFQEQARKLPI